MGRTCQHTPHISFGAVLLSRRILSSCLVEIQSRQSCGLPTQPRYASNIRLCAAYTQTPWLPVLDNIALPALRRRSATDKLLCNIEAHPNWPLYAYVFDHPQKRLVARRPIWADTTPVDQRPQWEEDWLSAAVVNSNLVCYTTIQQPGFNLPRHS